MAIFNRLNWLERWRCCIGKVLFDCWKKCLKISQLDQLSTFKIVLNINQNMAAILCHEMDGSGDSIFQNFVSSLCIFGLKNFLAALFAMHGKIRARFWWMMTLKGTQLFSELALAKQEHTSIAHDRDDMALKQRADPVGSSCELYSIAVRSFSPFFVCCPFIWRGS